MTLERRKAERFKGEIYISLCSGVIFCHRERPMCLVKDISKRGLSFVYPEAFPFGEKILFNLYLPMYARSVKVKALVKKSEKLPDGQYKTGVEFIKISPHVQKNLEPRTFLAYKARAKEE